MTQVSIDYQVNPRFVPDDLPLWLGNAKDSAIIYDATADELTIQTLNASAVLTDRIRVEAGTNTPFVEFVAGKLRLLDAAADPGAAGEFTRNGADIKFYTGGAVISLSDLGFGAPALTLGTTNVEGAGSAVRTGATIAAFDATAPVTQAHSDAAATGSATVAARRDHRHGMPAAATGVKMETGTYTGDGATSQVISLADSSIVVKYVKTVQRVTSEQNSEDKSITETTDTIVDDNASGISVTHNSHGSVAEQHTYDNNAIIAVGTGSFTVDDNGADSHPNKNSQVYNYLVIGT